MKMFSEEKMKNFDIVIIGAGSVGLPLSYFLAKKGKKVVVIDKMPSHGRGQNKAAIGGIRATHSDPAKINICQKSIEIIKEIEKEHGLDVDWIQGGYVYPVYDDERENALKSLLVKQKEYGLNIDWVPAEKIKELAPGILADGLRGGTYSPEDGSVCPMKLADAFYILAKRAGVEFKFNEEVTDIKHESTSITSLVTNKDSYEAELYINASGGDAKEICQMLDMEVPVQPDSHEGGVTEPVKKFFDPMLVDIRPEEGSANYYFYQNKENQIVFCITPEPKYIGKDMDNTSEFLPQVIKRMVNLYPRLRNIRVRRTWRGLYPMTPDGFPIVNFPENFSNLLLTVGMCGQGLMLGPGLGQILSEIIVDKTDKYDFILDQLSLYREFSGDEVLK